MGQVVLPSIEVMLILPTVVTPIVFLNHLCYFIEELHLCTHFGQLHFLNESVSASMPSIDFLDESARIKDSLEPPLDFEHAPVLLDVDAS